MQPKKYLRDLESSERRLAVGGDTLVAVLFLAAFYFLGPVIHEFAHIAVLEYYRCFYRFSFDFTLMSGFHASVQPYCSPTSSRLLLFYAVGYISTVMTAGLLSFAALKGVRWSRYLAALGSGMFLSVLLSIGIEGDIQNALQVAGIDQSFSIGIVLFTILGVFLSSLKTIQLFLKSEGKE